MAYRFSDTLKWSDSWFVELNAIEKLLFLYLCDNCDVGGFFELSIRKISFDLRSDTQNIIGALKGLERGLITSDDGSCILVKNFIRHQKNIPLNFNNKAHKGILSRFNMYAHKFSGLTLDPNIGYKIEAPSKPLQRGTGIGIGNDIDIEDYSNILLDDFEEKKSELILTLVKVWGFEPHQFSQGRSMIRSFVNSQMNSLEDIEHFAKQHADYDEYKKLSGEQRHNTTGFFGTQAMQFQNSAWNSENWSLKLEQFKSLDKNKSKHDKLSEAYNTPNPYENE